LFYVVVVIGALAPACSLFIPFDDYRGSPDSGANVVEGGAADGELDAEADDASCEASDKDSDPNNCGACGRICVEGAGSCKAGRCPLTTLYDVDGGTVQALALPHVDAGAHLYFTTTETFVARRALDTGAIETAPTSGGAARALAVSDDDSFGVTAVAVRTIDSFDPVDFANRPLATISTNHVGLGPVHLTGDMVFWGDSAGAWWSSRTPDAAAGGGSDAGTAPPVAFAEVNGSVLWVTSDGAVFSTPSKNPGAVMRLLASGTATFADIAVSKRYLYLAQKTSVGGGLVVYALANLATPVRTVALVDPQAVVTDEEFVYVLDFRSKAAADSRLWRTRIDGTQPIILADALRTSRGLAVDGQFVYFGDGPTVARTSK
jgi:hypothetical protein